MPPGARGQRFAAQDRLFAALERLEAKDTQHAAAEELTRLLKVDARRGSGIGATARGGWRPAAPRGSSVHCPLPSHQRECTHGTFSAGG